MVADIIGGVGIVLAFLGISSVDYSTYAGTSASSAWAVAVMGIICMTICALIKFAVIERE